MWDAAVDDIVSSTVHAYSDSTEVGTNSNVGRGYYPFGLGLFSCYEDNS